MKNNIIIFFIVFFSLVILWVSPSLTAQSILIFEDFETADFAAKGWYDGFMDQRTMNEHKNGSYAYEGHFAQGATTSGAGRHLFTPTDKVYISYWVKYSSNWVGSGVGYHPHEWSFLTNEDWEYQGPADTYLTTYIEQNGGKPLLALQDSKNVDPDCILLNNNSFIGCNGDFSTYPFTEDRSACSCNGIKGHLDKKDCFSSPGSSHGYYSARSWHADSIYFRDSPGPYYKNDWHKIEAYFELNSIVSGIGIPDGKIRYWYDGQLMISSDSILLRTGSHPDMKFNQLFYGPYIGVGSPVDQTWWVDDLTIADGLPVTRIKDESDVRSVFKLFPNPNDGTFTIRMDDSHPVSNTELYIIDIYGRKVHCQLLKNESETLDLNLPDGIYVCQLQNNRQVLGNKKMIVH